MINVNAVTRRYGPFAAVDDVTFSASPGRVTGFLGPNHTGPPPVTDPLREGLVSCPLERAPLGGEVIMGQPHARVSATPVSHREPAMVAMSQLGYGGPEVLTPARTARPIPGPDQALVRVHAASVNARDWHVMRGEPRLARLMDRSMFSLRRPRVPIRGTDLAGVVDSVGPGVTSWRKGDAVFGEGTGTLAEYALASASQLAAIPDGVTFEQAAALPLAATAAYVCLTAAQPAPGSRVLINGASGGVGTFAVQLARTMDLQVTAVVSSRNVALAEHLGAHRVVDYSKHDFTAGGDRYDVVIDLVGNRGLRDLRRAVRPGGKLVLSGGGVSGQGRFVGPLGLLLRAAALARFLPIEVLLPRAVPEKAVLARIGELVTTHRVTPVLDRRVPPGARCRRMSEVEQAEGQGA